MLYQIEKSQVVTKFRIDYERKNLFIEFCMEETYIPS